MTPEIALRVARDSDDGLYSVMIESGSMELGYYAPVGVDSQSPHEQDGVSIVQTVNGSIIRGDERLPFAPGDALFVAPGVEHRFVNFSDDFVAWVIFYRPSGGES